MARFSIFGARGFIGRHLCAHLERAGHAVERIGRNTLPAAGTSVGHAVYCIGLTADFRSQPTATARAHVGVLADVLDGYRFDSFLYLSSTRIYAGAPEGREDTPLSVRPQVPDQLYNLTKLAGEALCLAREDPMMRVARLSNVVGRDMEPANFLADVVAEALRDGQVLLRTAAQSAKDYIDIDDVCRALEAIALSGRERLYNVASGAQTTNRDVADLVARHCGARVSFAPDAPVVIFPAIDVSRLRGEFGLSPRPFAETFRSITGETVVEQRTA